MPKYSYKPQMKILWLGLFDLAFSREKCHRLPVPSKPGLASPAHPQPTPKYRTIAEILRQKIGLFSALFKIMLITVENCNKICKKS